MRAWIDLYSAHRVARTLTNKKWDSELRKRLIMLADSGHCDPSVEGRFTYKTRDSLAQWGILGDRENESIALTNLPDLAVADLTVMALVSRTSPPHLHQFTVMVEGLRQGGSPWALAVHLPDDRETAQNPSGDRQGLGAGSHAALHCHVGPDLDIAPQVRVPLPPLGPVELLDWVLSQILPNRDFEPAPWAVVKTALKKTTP